MKKTMGLNELKKTETKILEIFNDYCQKHGLKYYLAFGTLIGAILYKGFIPWDDDIDVMMPRPDYEKLIDGFNREYAGSDICLLSHSIDKKYYFPMAKLVNMKTTLIENDSFDYNLGVFIDIFPIDYLGDSIESARKRIKNGYKLNLALQIKTKKWCKERSLLKNIILMGGKTILARRDYSKILDDLETFCQKTRSNEFSKYVGVLSGLSKGDDTRIYRKEWFEETFMIEFEGKEYPAPKGADAILRRRYGDYTKLPPEEQRVSHHRFKAWINE